MINTEHLVELLKYKLGVDQYVGVPCSNLKYIINRTERDGTYIEAPNEGEAVAYAAGAYFAGKKVVVMMQNSGFANSLNIITSLSCIYKIPQIYFIGFRGMHGKGTDEPQHEVMGRVTPDWLVDCGIVPLYACKYSSELELVKDIESYQGRPIAVLFDKKDCTEVLAPEASDSHSRCSMSRSDVIREVVHASNDKTAVIATTGFTGRDLYDNYKQPNNFYMVGSMGAAISLGLGIAVNKPDKKVIVIDGDGAAMMRPQGGILFHNLHPDNLLHVIIDNGLYESTGKQYLPGRNRYNVAEMEVGIHQGGNVVMETTDPRAVKQVLDNFVEHGTSIKVLVVRVDPSKNNNTLGRPKETSVELSKQFMEFLND